MNVYFARLLRAALTVLACITFVFIVLRITGDPTTSILGDDINSATREHFERIYGLDQPLLSQYVNYLGALLTGDLGVSFRDGRPVGETILESLPKTLLLMGTSFILALLFGVVSGTCAALKVGTSVDTGIMNIWTAAYSLPNFFIGILLILLFTVKLQWLPAAGSASLKHLILPSVTIAAAYGGYIAKFTRAAVIEVRNSPFVLAAKARGLSSLQLLIHHIFPNASVPLLNISGMLIGGLIGGAAVTEATFAWPGVGRLLIGAVESRDLPVVQAVILLIATTMVVANLTVDFLHFALDPRVRQERRAS